MEPAPANPKPTEDLPRRVQPVALILLLVLAVLIGSRWYLDRFGTRPTEHNRNAAHRVDLNRASRNELMQLPGVGPATADRIVAHRESNGRFSKVEDLDQVPGIGDATVSKLRIWVKVDPLESTIPERTEPDRLTRKSPTPKSKSDPKSTAKGPIDVNRATLDELNTLPNIGPVIAQRIIDERTKKPFANIEDLRRVSGIGPKRIEALRGHVSFGE